MKRKLATFMSLLLTHLSLLVFLGLAQQQASCTWISESDVKDRLEEADEDEETTTTPEEGTDPETTTTETCDDNPSLHAVTDLAYILCVSKATDSAILTSGYCSSATTFSTIADAVAYREANFTYKVSIAIFLAEDTTYDESITLNSAQDSNTAFIGCQKSATIATPETGATAQTHAVSIDDDAENVSFYNLTMAGLANDYTGSAADYVADTSGIIPIEMAATLYIQGANNVNIENVTIEDNYYQGVLIDGTGSTQVFLTQVEVGSTVAPSDSSAGDYASTIGVWTESGAWVAISDLVLTGTHDVGVMADSSTLELDYVTFENTQVSALELHNGATVLMYSGTSFLNNNVAVFSADSQLSADNVSFDASNASYAIAACATTSTTVESALSNNTFGTEILFGTGTVEGNGNVVGTFEFTSGTVLNDQFTSLATTISPRADFDCDRDLLP